MGEEQNVVNAHGSCVEEKRRYLRILEGKRIENLRYERREELRTEILRREEN